MQENNNNKNWITIKNSFLYEAEELIALFLQYFLSFQENKNPLNNQQEILRILHSIKGSSLSFGFDMLSKFCHHLESILSELFKKNPELNKKEILFFIEAHSFIEKLIAFYKQNENQNYPENSENLKNELKNLMQASYSILNENLNNPTPINNSTSNLEKEPIHEINTQNNFPLNDNLNDFSKHFKQLKIDPILIQQIHQEISKLFLLRIHLKKIILFFKTFLKKKPFKYLPQLYNKNIYPPNPYKFKLDIKLIQKNCLFKFQNIKNILQNFEMEFSKLNQKIYLAIENIQRIEVRNFTPIFLRLHHEMSKDTLKQVNLQIYGEDLKIEKWIIDASLNPLIQIIKNAFDHGIEPYEERKIKGKNPKGTIAVTFKRSKYKIIIQVQDNGQGLQLEKIIDSAQKKGISIPKNPHNIKNLIFYPGLSTKSKANTISGRGIGLDIAKNTIEKFKGQLFVSFEKDLGSLFQIEFPLEFMVIEVLLFKIKKLLFSIPIEEIIEIIEIPIHSTQWSLTKSIYEFKKKKYIIPYIDLYLDNDPIKYPQKKITLVLCSYQNRKFGIKIDKILKEEKILTQENPIKSKKYSWILFNGLLKNGQICFIIDIERIYQSKINKNYFYADK